MMFASHHYRHHYENKNAACSSSSCPSPTSTSASASTFASASASVFASVPPRRVRRARGIAAATSAMAVVRARHRGVDAGGRMSECAHERVIAEWNSLVCKRKVARRWVGGAAATAASVGGAGEGRAKHLRSAEHSAMAGAPVADSRQQLNARLLARAWGRRRKTLDDGRGDVLAGEGDAELESEHFVQLGKYKGPPKQV